MQTTSEIILSSPLKTLTIFNSKSPPARTTFLSKFKKGISFQNKARKELQEEEQLRKKREEDGVKVLYEEEEYEEGQWAEYSLSKEEELMARKRRKLEDAFDKGFQSVKTPRSSRKSSEYQVVGVILPENGVKWYARKKPTKSNWNVRLVHVDKAALIRDLFVNGKVDLYATYQNKGRAAIDDGEEGEKKGIDIEPIYSIRERNWKTLWNINPVHYLTQRSGMYWREKRLKQGLYTDGESIYESVYRYTEGKNGMKPLDNMDLEEFLEGKEGLKEKILSGSPDVVLEY